MILPMEGDEASGWKPGKPSVFLNSPDAGTRADVLAGRAVAGVCARTNPGATKCTCGRSPGRAASAQISTGGGSYSDLVTHQTRALLRHNGQIMVARVFGGGRLVPCREAAALVRRALRWARAAPACSICTPTASGSRSRQSCKRQAARSRTRSSSSSTSSTSCAGSRRRGEEAVLT